MRNRHKRNNKTLFFLLFVAIDLIVVSAITIPYLQPSTAATDTTSTVAVKPVPNTVLATGTIQSQTQATLNFQTGGKLVSVPFQVGDTVQQGQTVAQLDTYTLQQQLQQALNTYKSTRDTFDQTQQNSQDNVLQTSLAPGQSNAQMDKGNAINDAAKRIVDQNQSNLNNSVINVQVANYALQLATLTSPISGVLTREDVTTPNVNVGPTTTFVVSDPNNIVFRANVPETNINTVGVGQTATITLDGLPDKPISGTVIKVYPTATTLPDGSSVYQVDIQSPDLAAYGKLTQTGSVLINVNNSQAMTVPSWTVVNGNSIWVMENNRPVLKKVTVGNTVGNTTTITSGLSSNDQVITDPQVIVNKKYILP